VILILRQSTDEALPPLSNNARGCDSFAAFQNCRRRSIKFEQQWVEATRRTEILAPIRVTSIDSSPTKARQHRGVIKSTSLAIAAGAVVARRAAVRT
jgi:hypothetical protein